MSLYYKITVPLVNSFAESFLRIRSFRLKTRVWKLFGVRQLSLEPKEGFKRIIIYIHGGSYLFKLTPKHLSFLKRLARDTSSKIIVPLYVPLPRITIEELVEKTTKIVSKILEEVGGDGRKIILMGDSAGGGLILTIFEGIVNNSRIDLTFLLSPFVKASFSGAEFEYARLHDPLLGEKKYLPWAKMMRTDVSHPLINPLFKDGEMGFRDKKIFFWYGGRELLLTQFIAMEARLVREGADVKRYFCPREIHDGPVFFNWAYKNFLDRFTDILGWDNYGNLKKQEARLVKRFDLKGNR